MRVKNITVTDSEVNYPDGCILGYIGEHCATQLVIALPEDMIAESDYLVAVFRSGGNVLYSGIIGADGSGDTLAYVADGKLYISLWQGLTANRELALTVEAYKVAEGVTTLIAKTPKIEYLTFLPAVLGTDENIAPAGLVPDVIELQGKAHTHPNKPTLDKLSEDDGNLLYDGEPVGGGLCGFEIVGNDLIMDTVGSIEAEINEFGELEVTING